MFSIGFRRFSWAAPEISNILERRHGAHDDGHERAHERGAQPGRELQPAGEGGAPGGRGRAAAGRVHQLARAVREHGDLALGPREGQRGRSGRADAARQQTVD